MLKIVELAIPKINRVKNCRFLERWHSDLM